MAGLRVLVSGMVAADPHQGGATWAVLQYVLGLRALGHDVFFVEPVPATSLRPSGSSLSNSVNAAYFAEVVKRFDLVDRATLLIEDTGETVGVAYAALSEFASCADVLINISGMLTDERLLGAIGRRVYLDLDPTFIQLWHAVEGLDMRLDGHTHFATVGQFIGDPACEVPTCGRTWIHTLPPIVLAEWPFSPGSPQAAWTTVAHWRGYGSVQHDGVSYGQKAHSLRRFFNLPGRTTERLELALAIDPAETNDLEALLFNRWRLVDPALVAATPDRYQRFIHGSKGEFGIAKSGYVQSQCGWFSDRSVCYLASGRPVVAQDTGFSKVLPTGEGLLAFRSLDEAASALEVVKGDYDRHCRRAREMAEAHFASGRVLGRLLDQVGGTVGGSTAGSGSAVVGRANGPQGQYARRSA